MTVTTRLAAVDDAPIIGALLDAMDQHYRGAEAARDPALAVAMARTCIDAQEGTRFLLAFDGEVACGIACFVVIRPGRLLSGLVFLKDLFVLDHARNRGVGGALLQALAAFTLENGLDRLDLNTEVTNRSAQRLYDRLGGERVAKVSYRFDTPALARLAGPPEG